MSAPVRKRYHFWGTARLQMFATGNRSRSPVPEVLFRFRLGHDNVLPAL